MFTADVKPSHKMRSVYHDCPFFPDEINHSVMDSTPESRNEGQPVLYGLFFQDKMELALLFTLPLTHEE